MHLGAPTPQESVFANCAQAYEDVVARKAVSAKPQPQSFLNIRLAPQPVMTASSTENSP
jgi:hypothetical protein